MTGPPAAPELAPLSRRLQEGTRAVHEAVEHGATFNRLIVVRIPEPAPDASASERARHARAHAEYREVYRRFLVAAHGFEAAVDRRLAESPAHAEALRTGYAPEPFLPTALIHEDLRHLTGADGVEALEPMDGLPEADTLGAFAGLEYVRRGSRAGGAVIAAVVQRNLGLDRERGASFLGAHGKATRAVITAYKDWVDRLGLADAEVDHAVATAVATFEAVGRWHRRLEERFARG